MSWDPNQGSQPGSGPNPYEPPQNPYGAPPQNPYTTPPQNPYTAPPQDPYGTPPPAGSGYQPDYGYAAPASAPLPLGQALAGLPRQYLKAVTKPSPRTFAEEMGKADWGIVWLQILFYVIIYGVLRFLASLINPIIYSTGTTTLPSSSVQLLTVLSSGVGSVFYAIIIFLFIFLWNGLVYMLAKAFGGQGRFVTQMYTFLLFAVPLGILSGLIGIVPIVGTIVAFALLIYDIVLNIFSVMAAHRLSGGRATGAVLIPIGILVLLICVLGLVLGFLLAAAINSGR
ncbi:MAG: YIP1 family protein [Ktedonobacteraceae bacterium]|nr:YIP1 family protein [Ktedonobacteraceae bacterium]